MTSRIDKKGISMWKIMVLFVAAMMLIGVGVAWAETPVTQPIPATQVSEAPATRPVARSIPFDTHNGYFVSNKFEPTVSASFIMLEDQTGFEEVFGSATVMGDKSHRLPADVFDTKMVIAAIKRENAVWEFAVKGVAMQDDILTIRYTATSKKSDSAEFASPLIIALPRAFYLTVRFEENGKLVKTLDMPWWQMKQTAALEALHADAELNKVYKQLMAVLDNDEKKLLVASERAWITFRDAECEFESNYTGSGSDRGMNYPNTATALTEARTAELRRVLANRTPKSGK